MSNQTPPKPWSAEQFEQYRSHMTEFVDTKVIPAMLVGEYPRICIHADVKSGKREMVEYLSTVDITRAHAFVSAFHRRADEAQREELAQHQVEIFSLTSRNPKSFYEDFQLWMTTQLEERQVVLHWDECDHGSGSDELLAKLWNDYKDHPDVFNILYSATPEEFLYSGEASLLEKGFRDARSVYLRYNPPKGYCGAKRFLEEGLVYASRPFIEESEEQIVLSHQARQIIQEVKDGLPSRRNIVVLRLTGNILHEKGGGRNNKQIYHFLKSAHLMPELEDVQIIVDDDQGLKSSGVLHPKTTFERVDWSDPDYWSILPDNHMILVLHDQTSCRSTEWAFHDRIWGTHDYRPRIRYNTVAQAQFRVAHYEDKYGGFQPIKIFGHLKTFQFASGRINIVQYYDDEWVIKRVKKTDNYRIVHTLTGETHPVYSDEMTKEFAEELLWDLGYGTKPQLTDRLRGHPCFTYEMGAKWYPTTRKTIKDTLRVIESDPELPEYTRNHRFKDPFLMSIKLMKEKGLTGKFPGIIRDATGEVFDWEFIRTQKAGLSPVYKSRITICYQGEELGIAVRYLLDRVQTEHGLEAGKTMYA